MSIKPHPALPQGGRSTSENKNSSSCSTSVSDAIENDYISFVGTASAWDSDQYTAWTPASLEVVDDTAARRLAKHRKLAGIDPTYADEA